MKQPMEQSLADGTYWDGVWKGVAGNGATQVVTARDPYQRHLETLFSSYVRRGRFLEVGAGGSAWPSHLARFYQSDAWGIDLSEPGLELCRRSAARLGAEVRLIHADLFDPYALPRRYFDVVYSGGFVEHFPEPGELMRRLAELVAPTGIVVTTVPNFEGVNGWLQRTVDRSCYDRHVVHTPGSLDAIHAQAGLQPIRPTEYVGGLDLGSVNWSRMLARVPRTVERVFWASLGLMRTGADRLAPRGGRLLAPNLVGVYRLR